jgi:hypothetical protein
MEMSVRQRRGNEVLVVVNPSYKTGHKRQKLINLTARMPIVNPEATTRVPERERIAFEPGVLDL